MIVYAWFFFYLLLIMCIYNIGNFNKMKSWWNSTITRAWLYTYIYTYLSHTYCSYQSLKNFFYFMAHVQLAYFSWAFVNCWKLLDDPLHGWRHFEHFFQLISYYFSTPDTGWALEYVDYCLSSPWHICTEEVKLLLESTAAYMHARLLAWILLW